MRVFEDELDGRLRPPLDPGFLPPALWNRVYRQKVEADPQKERLVLALERSPESVSVHETEILCHKGENRKINEFCVERLLKFLLWQKGGHRITVAGNPELAAHLAGIYTQGGRRAFDYDLIGVKVYDKGLSVVSASPESSPLPSESSSALGRHLDGCRIGFDLGGSDRKCAAVLDGRVVHSEEVAWDPYFQSDPQWHYDGINDSLRRAAAKLPRVDAIGGSAAGVYVDNEVRVASLFRGVSPELFRSRVRGIFRQLREEWAGVPFVVVNDGEVTALAGSMSLNDNAVLGVAMGTSLAAGYVTPRGTITDWLNELAFVPVDFQEGAPRDEWSGDEGVGAQYFSQQAVGRLLEPAGISLDGSMSLAEKLVAVQDLMEGGDPRAEKIYRTIGVTFGYTIAHFSEYYDVRNLLVLGRVMSGTGGELILEEARQVLSQEFPQTAEQLRLRTLSETEKRHGQAVAAASLPSI